MSGLTHLCHAAIPYCITSPITNSPAHPRLSNTIRKTPCGTPASLLNGSGAGQAHHDAGDRHQGEKHQAQNGDDCSLRC